MEQEDVKVDSSSAEEDAVEPVRSAVAEEVSDAGQESRGEREGAGDADGEPGDHLDGDEGADRCESEPGLEEIARRVRFSGVPESGVCDCGGMVQVRIHEYRCVSCGKHGPLSDLVD